MDRPSRRPLTVEEAKNRLRNTMDENMPSSVVRRHPLFTLVVALGIGYILGRHPQGDKIVGYVTKKGFLV